MKVMSEFFIDDLDGEWTVGRRLADGQTQTIGVVRVPQTLTKELLEDIVEMMSDYD